MAHFEWDDPTSCGEAPPEVCDALETVTTGRSIVVTDPSSLCSKELVSDEYPAIASLIGESQTQGRSGSSSSPISLTRVQTYTGSTVPELFFRNEAGQLSAWNPPLNCDNQRVVIRDGDFAYIPDVNSNVYDESCIGSIQDVTLIAGGAQFTDCNGNTKVKLVFFPREEFCDFCPQS